MHSSAGILTYDQYADLEKRGIALPYIVELGAARRKLLLYGANHTNDLQDAQFQDIEARWEGFLASTERPIALVEGRYDELAPGATKDRTQSIIAGGEAQFLVYLARKDQVAVASPEPDRLWEADELAKEFGKDQVIFYYLIRQIEHWNRLTKQPDIKTEAQAMLALMKKSYNWKEVTFSFEYMDAMHRECFNKPIPLHDRTWLYGLITPATQEHITNQLARRSGELRDQHIFTQIETYWQAGRSPFIVLGASHAVMLEPALRVAIR